MMNIIIAIVLIQNVNTVELNNKPSVDKLDKTIKVIRLVHGIK